MITEHLRHPSSRPQVIVDHRASSIGNPTIPERLGRPGPFSRERVVFALPTNAVELKFPDVVVDHRARLLSDPLDSVISPADGDRVIVHRMLWATKAEDTRRL